MQIDRLLEITLLLLQRGQVTARELAERFQVSTRTIYRDMDALSLAGVPVYTTKGKGGGIGLLPEYTLDRSFLSDQEQKDIVFALQTLRAAQYPGADNTLTKLHQVFKNVPSTDWIEVDFSYWGSAPDEKEKFHLLKEALLTHRVLAFDYYNSAGGQSARVAEPLRLLFKGHSWYLSAFCRTKQDYRFFRVSRMRGLRLTDQAFDRPLPPPAPETQPGPHVPLVTLRLQFHPSVAYRVFDDFSTGTLQPLDGGAFIVTIQYPLEDWVIGYILSFGDAVEVLDPPFMRDMVAHYAQKVVQKYIPVP